MTQDFYRAFEDRFRGSREDIKARLSVYTPWLETLAAQVPQRQALDIGCGRGEWLEVLAKSGFEATGVDIDAGMLAACHAHGLDVNQTDGLAALHNAGDNSLAIVSAFHVVEHLPFDQVLELIEQAHRTLVPGGLLILETPNSENLGVGTFNFYLDPTHKRPIPHLLLQFAAVHGGFEDAHILRVNHDSSLVQVSELSLLDVLCRASPDYGIVAMKGQPNGMPSLEVFADCLTDSQGLSLEMLGTRFDHQYSGALRHLDAELYALKAQFENFQQVEAKLLNEFSQEANAESAVTLERFIKSRQMLADRVDKLERQQQADTETLTERCQALTQAIEGLQASLTQRQAELLGMAQQLRDVHDSTSWRITRPLRWAVGLMKRLLSRHG